MAPLMWERVDAGLAADDSDLGPVTVADELRLDGQPALRCPASVLLAGELQARGVPAARGPVLASPVLTGPAQVTGGARPPRVVAAAELGGGIALAVAAAEPWQAHARSVVGDWLSVARERTILLPAPRSFCAGVERAIKAVEQALTWHDGPVYVRKQVVHNKTVVADLESRGAIFVEELDQVPRGATVVFSAHGVSPAVRREASDRGLAVIDTTCPLVRKIHTEARRFAALGNTIVLVGHPGHEETVGIIGEAPQSTVVVQDSADVAALDVPDPAKVAYLTQTTLAVDETAKVVTALRRRFPALREPASDDICYATTNRQRALAAVSAEADLVLVVGSANSSNSERLVELARRRGTPAYRIDGAADIRVAWLASVRTIALTAGASAPPHLISTIVDALAGLGQVHVIEREAIQESIHFTLPHLVRS
jgi:4-hydroxy-3-methylbut-2-enyl diphosphate reductase